MSDEESPEESPEQSRRDPRERRRGALQRALFPEGPGISEPDPRFSLANERTFLAWVRTSLAFIGAGIALEAFVPAPDHALQRTLLALLLVLVGAVTGVSSGVRWWRVERALRSSRALPIPVLLPVLVLLLAMGGALAMFFIITLDLT